MRAERRDEGGAVLVELAVAIGLLSLLLFGIITFGVTLSFRQSLTQAGNEAARAAAVAPASPPGTAVNRARDAVNRTMAPEGTGCNDGRGLTCSFVVTECADDPERRCMEIELVYALRERPRVVTMPMVDRTLPETMRTSIVVEVEAGA